MSTARRLSADHWAAAALETIAEGGVDQLTVEGLARRLGVTKGSFYWHFADRSALVEAALALWEQRATTAIIERFEPVADPVERLAGLVEAILGDRVHGPIDALLVARGDDPAVGPTVARVASARIAFLERALRQSGLTPTKARMRAKLLYSVYVGHVPVRRALGDDADLTGPSAAYRRELVAMFTAP